MMKIIQYFLLLACGVTLCSCSSGPTSVVRVIDNPTANEIVIAIDGKELAIPANSKTKYTFEYGKHNLAYNNESFDFVVKPAKFSGKGFINPTQSNYMLHTIVYSTDNTSEEDYKKFYEETLHKIPIIFNGEEEEVELPVKVVNDIFIEDEHNKFDYSIDQKMPKEIHENIYKNQTYQDSRTKVYREKEYINFLKNEYSEFLNDEGGKLEISFPNKPIKLAEINQYAFPTINLEKIECDAGKKYLAETLDNWKQLYTLKGSDFASKYEELGGDKSNGNRPFARYKELCPKDTDRGNTDVQTVLQLDNFIRDTRDIHFYIIK
ncbi:hypothetical protein [uncultured Apibacter sp.]|uniref:hypothetical protein n=1 Tax=uncultured Apibacter sp. TaxID=1778616 RepID=UPI0025E6B616|nr:hypothetical protein [uncultured Apibacter sp.]